MTEPTRLDADRNIALDLANCDREPIHIPGSIQPHGALLALDPETLILRQYSSNLPALLGHPGDEVLAGATLESLFGEDQAKELGRALKRAHLDETPRYLATVTLPGDSSSR